MQKEDRWPDITPPLRRDYRAVTVADFCTAALMLEAVRSFDAFTPEDDPYEEHDYAAIVLDGERYLWKIDYFDLSLQYRSPDPSDPAFTIRVMTIMRADEY